MVNAILLHALRDEWMKALQHVVVLPHGDGVSDRPEHFDVVGAVAEAVGVFLCELQVLQDVLDRRAFAVLQRHTFIEALAAVNDVKGCCKGRPEAVDVGWMSGDFSVIRLNAEFRDLIVRIVRHRIDPPFAADIGPETLIFFCKDRVQLQQLFGRSAMPAAASFKEHQNTVRIGGLLQCCLHFHRQCVIVHQLAFIDQLGAAAAEKAICIHHIHDALQHAGGTAGINEHFISFFAGAPQRLHCTLRNLMGSFIDQSSIHVKKQSIHL